MRTASRPFRPRRAIATAVSVALAVVAVSAAPAGAATVTFGSPLDNAPNVAGGCETKPMVSWNDFDTYQPVASGEASCTWWQTGTFGVDPSTDARKGYVPGDGTITSVTVRSGPNPAPIRIVVARQLTAFGPNAPLSGPVCCVFAGQSDELRPAPNTTTTFPLSLPVEQHRDLQAGIQTDDIVGINAASNAGTLPLFAIPGQTRQSAYTQPGTLDASAMWPALGTQANDTGGGRSATGFAGFEVTARFTWCGGAAARARAAAATGGCGDGTTGGGGGPTNGGGGGGGGGNGGPGGGAGQPPALRVGLTTPRQTIAAVRRRGALRVRCTLDAAGTCAVRATVDAATAKRLGLRRKRGTATVQIASGKATLRAAGSRTVAVRLTKAATAGLRRAKSAVRVRVATTGSAAGRTTATTATTLRLRR